MAKKQLTAIMYGWITILFFILFTSAILALIIRYTTITEFTLSYLTLITGLLILFIGGLIAGLKGKANGWMIGLITGLGFSLLTFFIQYLGFNDMFTIKQTIFHITYILCAIFGSVIGVNILSPDQEDSTT